MTREPDAFLPRPWPANQLSLSAAVPLWMVMSLLGWLTFSQVTLLLTRNLQHFH